MGEVFKQYGSWLRTWMAVWLWYDLVDLWTGGTARILNMFTAQHSELFVVQCALIVLEALIVFGSKRLFWLAWVACTLTRGWFALRYFALNDFLYYTVFGVWVVLFYHQPAKHFRRVMLLQHAWIYLATSVLKMNEDFLSGGHVFVRHQYLLFEGWFEFMPVLQDAYRWLASIEVSKALSWLVVVFELAIGVCWLLASGCSKRVRQCAWALVLAIHVPAMFLDNVWFFGAAMIIAAWAFVLSDPAQDEAVKSPERSSNALGSGDLPAN